MLALCGTQGLSQALPRPSPGILSGTAFSRLVPPVEKQSSLLPSLFLGSILSLSGWPHYVIPQAQTWPPASPGATSYDLEPFLRLCQLSALKLDS